MTQPAPLTPWDQIGGSLAKLVYFSSDSTSSSTADTSESGGRLNFLKFETADRIDECIELMRKLQQKHRSQLQNGNPRDLCVVATGGGAFKYYDEIRRRVGVEVLREDEMECLIIGTAPKPQTLCTTPIPPHHVKRI